MDDYISRQAAIDAICKEGTRLERNGTVAMCEIKQWCIDLLERLPSAQPELPIKEKCCYCPHCTNCDVNDDLTINQPEPIKLHFDHALTEEEIKNLKQKITDSPIVLMPSAQPEPHEIGYPECANAMLKMWIDNVLTDGEYSRIMDKLNAHWAERREE